MAESKYEWLRSAGKTFLTSEDSESIAHLAIEVGESMISLADELDEKVRLSGLSWLCTCGAEWADTPQIKYCAQCGTKR